MKLRSPADGPSWLPPILRRISQAMGEVWESPLRLQEFAKASLPSAATWRGGMVFVNDEAGGATLAFSDGTNWRRVQDRAIVS